MDSPLNKPPRKNKKASKKAASKKQPDKARTAPTGTLAENDDMPENDVHYEKQFVIYALWKSLPPMLRGETAAELEKKYFIDDEEIIQLLQIRTQRQFADHYDLNEKTLWRWNMKLKDRDLFADIRAWSNGLVKNVIMSTYRASMLKDPKASSDRKLFLQFAGWGEEMTVHNKGESLADIIKRDLGIK